MVPSLKVEATSIKDAEGHLCFNLYKLYEESWPSGRIILATPNIPIAQLEELQKQIRTLANAESLDLDVIIAMAIEDGKPKETKRWRLGWDDGTQIFMHLFPQEFFQLPGAEGVYNQWVEQHQND